MICYQIRYQTRARKQIRERIDGTAVVGLILAYTVVVGLFTLSSTPSRKRATAPTPVWPPSSAACDGRSRHAGASGRGAAPGAAARRNPKSPRAAADDRTRCDRRTRGDPRTRVDRLIRFDRACRRRRKPSPACRQGEKADAFAVFPAAARAAVSDAGRGGGLSGI